MLTKKNLLVSCLIFLTVFVSLGNVATPVYADSSWRARYWNNTTLSGDPVLERNESELDHDWDDDSPASAVNADNFSARWTRDIDVTPGLYRFEATTDDGMRVWVDDNLIIDSWYDSQSHTIIADVYLSDDDYDLKVEYYEAGGGAVAKLTWYRVSGPPAAPSTPAPTPTPPTTPTSAWRAAYYNNVSLEGTPALVRDDEQIDFIWGSSSPAPNVVDDDNFSVRWTRTLNFDPGRYVFTAKVDGGVRLWVDEQLIIDEWNYIYRVETYHGVIDLSGGPVPVRMEFFEHVGLAEATLSWYELGTDTTATDAAPQSSQPSGELTATMVNAIALNVRSGPGFDFEPFDHLSRGQVVELTGYRDASASWIQIRLPNGETGWAGASYLASDTPFIDLAVWNG